MKKAVIGDQRPEPLRFACEVCGGLASAGEGVALLKGQRGRWWCQAHLPDRLRRDRPTAGAPPPAEVGIRPSPVGGSPPGGPAPDRRQGKLL